MVFSSFTFLILFLPMFLAVYFLVPNRLRNGILFLGSLLFYAWGEPVYVILLLFSTAVDFFHGILAERWRGTRLAKAALISSIAVNVGLLGIFKYSAFAAENLNRLLGLSLTVPVLALPIGISFYTFQTMSYTIDVYRGRAAAQHNFVDFGAYVSMFPQLIAGPIVRYTDVQRELSERSADSRDFYEGLRRFLTGLGKKVLLANPCGELWQLYSEEASLTFAGSWIGILAFGLQIYFDFSGYSDMAIGLGRILGFSFPENFCYPYVSRSVTEFWRRWHISLGTWFREYVYIPLGGNKKGLRRQICNLIFVWSLTGIWHGASWNFLLWGLYFAFFLILEKTLLKNWMERRSALTAHICTLLVLAVGWVLFAFESLPDVCGYLVHLAGFSLEHSLSFCGWMSSFDWYQLRNYGCLLLLAVLGSTPFPGKWLSERLSEKPWLETICLLLLLVLCVACLAADSYNPFLYFRF